MQGDLIIGAPLLQPQPDGGVHIEPTLAVAMTATCDYALKGGGPERMLVPVEVLAPDDKRLQRWQDQAKAGGPIDVPIANLYLPHLADYLPMGGLIHFRQAFPIHAVELGRHDRIATLNQYGVRSLLRTHFRFYSRVDIALAHIELMPDDPRRLWQAIDTATVVPSLADRRHRLETAVDAAIEALAHHHGIKAPRSSAEDSESGRDRTGLFYAAVLSRLSETTTLPTETIEPILPAETIEAVDKIISAHKTLESLYKVVPKDLPSHENEFNKIITAVEAIAYILQEENPVQVTAADLKQSKLSNLVRQ